MSQVSLSKAKSNSSNTRVLVRGHLALQPVIKHFARWALLPAREHTFWPLPPSQLKINKIPLFSSWPDGNSFKMCWMSSADCIISLTEASMRACFPVWLSLCRRALLFVTHTCHRCVAWCTVHIFPVFMLHLLHYNELIYLLSNCPKYIS